jgi:predicted ATP-dependent serine protease
MDKFTFGQCSVCGEHKALMNGICKECNDKNDMPDFFKDIFGGFKNE